MKKLIFPALLLAGAVHDEAFSLLILAALAAVCAAVLLKAAASRY